MVAFDVVALLVLSLSLLCVLCPKPMWNDALLVFDNIGCDLVVGDCCYDYRSGSNWVGMVDRNLVNILEFVPFDCNR